MGSSQGCRVPYFEPASDSMTFIRTFNPFIGPKTSQNDEKLAISPYILPKMKKIVKLS